MARVTPLLTLSHMSQSGTLLDTQGERRGGGRGVAGRGGGHSGCDGYGRREQGTEQRGSQASWQAGIRHYGLSRSNRCNCRNSAPSLRGYRDNEQANGAHPLSTHSMYFLYSLCAPRPFSSSDPRLSTLIYHSPRCHANAPPPSLSPSALFLSRWRAPCTL